MLDYAEGELARVDFDELTSRIVEPIRMHRPEVILTFGADGVTGDPEHGIVSRATTLAFERAGQPLAYEDDIEEDQVAWRTAKLYHLVVPQSAVGLLGEHAPTNGYGSSETGGILELALDDLASLKLAAISRHVSQIGSEGPFAGWDPGARDQYLATEHYRLVRSNVAIPAGLLQQPEGSLFDGLP